MIKLLDTEISELIHQNRHHNLVRTVHHYYVKNDDWYALHLIADMRGYDWKIFRDMCVEGLRYV